MEPVGHVAVWGFLLSIFLLVTPCYGETKYVYFGDFTTCDSTTSVGREDIVIVKGERNSASSSSSFSDCSLMFKAASLDDKLCVKINKIEFNKETLELQYFNSLDPTGITPYQTFSQNTGPMEICSNEREISMKLHRKRDSANIRDIVMDISVVNMQGSKRIAHMDEDCGLQYNLSDSTVHVQNRNSQGAGQVVPVCQLYFRYVGGNPNKTVCIKFMRLKSDCNYDLKIVDGASDLGLSNKHVYNCKNDKPQEWCSDRGAMHLELANKGTVALAASTFSVTVKDGIKGDVTFPTPGPEPTPIWKIVVGVIGGIVGVAAIIVLAVYCIKKSKGMRQSEVHMEQI